MNSYYHCLGWQVLEEFFTGFIAAFDKVEFIILTSYDLIK